MHCSARRGRPRSRSSRQAARHRPAPLASQRATPIFEAVVHSRPRRPQARRASDTVDLHRAGRHARRHARGFAARVRRQSPGADPAGLPPALAHARRTRPSVRARQSTRPLPGMRACVAHFKPDRHAVPPMAPARNERAPFRSRHAGLTAFETGCARSYPRAALSPQLLASAYTQVVVVNKRPLPLWISPIPPFRSVLCDPHNRVGTVRTSAAGTEQLSAQPVDSRVLPKLSTANPLCCAVRRAGWMPSRA